MQDSTGTFDTTSRDDTVVVTPPRPLSPVREYSSDVKEKAADVTVANVESADSISESPARQQNEADEPIKIYSQLRKYSLLALFCLAQFLDIFNLSAAFAAIPTIAKDLNMTGSESVWIVSALQLTFSAFLLVSGRISDVYSAKYSFIVGTAAIGAISIGTGFVRNKIGLFILRAFNGIASSLTIPAALNLIVKVFPVPEEQSRAIAMFGATGGIANTLGIIIGALFVQFQSWHWVFWFAAIIGLPIATVGLWLIPPEHELYKKSGGTRVVGELEKLKGLDLIGVTTLTLALILFIFAIVEGSSQSGSDSTSWGKGKVIAPLVISIFMIVGFLYYETLIPDDQAVVPPSIWFRPNFAILFGIALLPDFWWTTNLLLFLNYWQNVFDWSVVGSAARTVPNGVAAICMVMTSSLAHKFSPKYFILIGLTLEIIAGCIFPFTGHRDEYWSRVFPAFILGSAGTMLVFLHGNIAIFQTTPPHMAGTVGAIFNSALQLGAAVGSAVITSISTSIENRGPGDAEKFQGRADAFWFVLAVIAVETICVVIFYKPTVLRSSGDAVLDEKNDIEKAPPAREPENVEEGRKEPTPSGV